MCLVLAATMTVLAACEPNTEVPTSATDGGDVTSTSPPGGTTTLVLGSSTTTSFVASSSTSSTVTSTSSPTTTTIDVNSLAEGSGCTPGTDTTLPDGEWFGFFDFVSAVSVDFDLACFFVGDAATIAAAEDGAESPPPNDYHIRNVNPLVRTLEVSSATEVTLFGGDDSDETIPEVTVSLDEWVALFDDGRPWVGESPPSEYWFLPAAGGTPYWLTMENGTVSQIRQQYLP